MAEIPEAIQAGFDAEFEALQEARRRIESDTSLRPQEREMALGRIAEREMAHVRRVQAESQRAQDNEVMVRKVRTAQQQGGVGVRHTSSGGVEVQHAEPSVGAPDSLRERTAAEVDQELARLQAARREADADPQMTPERRLRIEQDLRAREQQIRQQYPATPQQSIVTATQGGATATQGSVPFATPDVTAPPLATASGRPLGPRSPLASSANFPTGQATPLTEGGDPRGTLPAATVAGTPRRRGAAQPALPSPPQPGEEGYVKPDVYTGQDPYNPQNMYAPEGPVDEIRETFLQQGKIEQDAGLASAADVMSAAEEIRAQREMAYQRMREDLVSQENRLRELDVQLGALRNMQFDSDRLFRNGHGVSLALGIAVGAMQQTINNALFPGSNAPNTAMQLVNDAIERDLREQAVNFQRGVTTLGMGRTSYEMARQMGMDHVAAYEYASATAQDYVARQLNARRLTMGAGVAAQQAHRAEQELLMSAQMRKQAAFDDYVQSQMSRRGGGGAGRRSGAGVPVFPRAGIAPGVTMSPADVRKEIGDATWNEIRDVTFGGDRVISILDQMKAIMDGGQGNEYFSRVRGQLESLSGQLLGAIKQSMQLGALDNGVQTLVDRVVTDPTSVGGLSIWQNRIRGQMQALRGETVRTVRTAVNYMGQGKLVYDEGLVERAQAPTPPEGFEDTTPQTQTGATRTEEFVGAVARNPRGAATAVGSTVFGLDSRAIEQGIENAVGAFRGDE